jgi:hypothetical protein
MGINVEPDASQESSSRAGGLAGREENRSTERDNFADRKSPADHEESEDVVLVDAPKSVIVEFLSELKDDEKNYSSIAIDEPVSGKDLSAANGKLKKEVALDLGEFNRGVVAQKVKEDASGRYYAYDLGRERSQSAAPRGGVEGGQQVRRDEAKQIRRNAIEPAGPSRARRLLSFDANRAQVNSPTEQGHASGVPETADESVMPRSASGAPQAAGGENDNLQVLFVVSPEQEAKPTAPAAKPEE